MPQKRPEVVLTIWRKYIALLGTAGAVVAADQWSKAIVRTELSVGEVWAPFPWLMPYARFINWNNTGAAFGVFPSGGLIFTAVAVAVAVFILYYYPRVPAEQRLLRAALGLQLGGAIGNLIDRLLHGPVTDFISVGSFAVFNIADASISIGTALLVWVMWREEREKGDSPSEGEQSEHPAVE